MLGPGRSRRRWQRLDNRGTRDLRHARGWRSEHLRMHDVGLGIQAGRNPEEQRAACRHRGGGDDPDRQPAPGRPIGRGNPLPAPRQLPLGGLSLDRDDGVRLGTQPVERAGIALGLPVAPHEAERQAQIHQLDCRQEPVGIPLHLPELIEERIGAANAMVERRHQRLRRPEAGGTPRRVEHDIIDAGTQCVMRRTQQLHRDAEHRVPVVRSRAARVWRVRGVPSDPPADACCAGGRAVAAAALPRHSTAKR